MSDHAYHPHCACHACGLHADAVAELIAAADEAYIELSANPYLSTERNQLLTRLARAITNAERASP